MMGGYTWDASKLAPNMAVAAIREMASGRPSEAVGFICIQEVRSWGKIAGRIVSINLDLNSSKRRRGAKGIVRGGLADAPLVIISFD